MGPAHRPSAAPGHRVAGPADGGPVRRAGRRRAAAAGARAHRPRPRPVLLRHEDGVAAARTAAWRPDRTSPSAPSTPGCCGTSLAARCYATDPSNASRTMLFDIARAGVEPRAGRRCSACPLRRAGRGAAVERPLRRDRRAARRPPGRHRRSPASPATSRRRCSARRASTPGMTKNTYGTGSFVLMNVGARVPAAGRRAAHDGGLDARRRRRRLRPRGRHLRHRRRHPVAARRPRHHRRRPTRSARSRPRCPTPAASYVVPAFTGLGSPWWDPYARGTIVGISRGVTRAHLARAVVEAMAFQTRDVVDAMVAASGRAVAELRVDGGAAVMDLLLQLQADQLGVTVRRPRRPGDDGARRRLPRRPGRGRVGRPRRARRPLAARRRRSTPAEDRDRGRRRLRPVAPRRRALPPLGTAATPP